jgi:hypothetical protein
MASIERTAYPRFRHEPNARELQDLFTPAQEEVDFVRSLARSSEHAFASVLLLKCLQFLGYFPDLSEIPVAVICWCTDDQSSKCQIGKSQADSAAKTR